MVRVYFNIPKKTFSLQRKINGQWKVTEYVNFFKLESARFIVSEKGRQRVLKNKRKNVHAYITGEKTDKGIKEELQFSDIRYNPYEMKCFTEESGEPVLEAEFVIGFVVDKKPKVLAFWNTK